jgi:1-acyl-sn-glycerol-3-phosphate acyltransferase
MSSIFTTPILTPLLRAAARAGLRVVGWRVDLDELPRPPFLFIGAPHTSNWDFMLMVATVLVIKMDAKWVGKISLFAPPFGGIMRWMGGIPVDRSKSQNLVEQVADTFRTHPELIICISPEGTRKRVDRWKTGFYHIARLAEVPIVMTVIDAETRAIRLLGCVRPAGDAEREIRDIQRHYHGFHGLIPENSFQLKEEHDPQYP